MTAEYNYQEAMKAREAQQAQTDERRAEMVRRAQYQMLGIKQSKKYRRADRRFYRQMLLCVTGLTCVCVAHLSGHMSFNLAMILDGALLSIGSFWAGAWIQFRWCMGGLLDG